MYLISSDEKSIIDTSFVERFCVVEKPDAVMIVASYSEERMVTVGKYADKNEAMSAFESLYSRLCENGNYTAFRMPDSVLFHKDEWKRDARTKRKGGS